MYDLMVTSEGVKHLDFVNAIIEQGTGINQVIFDCPFTNTSLNMVLYQLTQVVNISAEELICAVLSDYINRNNDAANDIILDSYSRLYPREDTPSINVAKFIHEIIHHLIAFFSTRIPPKYYDCFHRYELQGVWWTTPNTIVARYAPLPPWQD